MADAMQPTGIMNLRGREILDSRGYPTTEAEVTLTNGLSARSAVPSGASTGKYEALEKRDNEARYNGKGVRGAVRHINEELARAVVGADASEPAHIDERLLAADGSEDKSCFGANALLAVSLAVHKVAAQAARLPLYEFIGKEKTLPVPLMNILNGGAHADNALDIQEFMIVPHGFSDFAEALRAGCEVFYALRRDLAAQGLITAVGDEGGYAPEVRGTEAALTLIVRAIENAGYCPAKQISIALDCAASEFYREERYHLAADGFCGDAEALIALLSRWVADYPIVSIEDACDEDDWHGWQLLSRQLGKQIQLVGDDLFVTNPRLLTRGIDEGVANALLVKPNQIGTVSEMLAAVKLAQAAGYQTVMSHRSGETEYADIADLAVGSGCQQIKTGAPCRGERTAKYNQLLRIADSLGSAARYAGAGALYAAKADSAA